LAQAHRSAYRGRVPGAMAAVASMADMEYPGLGMPDEGEPWHAGSPPRTAQTERLKEMLVEQAMQHERLSQEMSSRDWERWQLLQLLRQKDEQLAWQEEAISRQRAVLTVSRDSSRWYQVLSVFRAWHDHVQRLGSERTLARTKSRLARAMIRDACGKLRVTLKSAVSRELNAGMQAIWLHAASEDLQVLDGVEVPPSADAARDSGCFKEMGRRSSAESAFRYLSDSAATEKAGTELTSPLSQVRGLLAEPPEDQVLYATPRHDSLRVPLKHQLSRDGSPQLKFRHQRHASPPSDASTCAPSSSSQSRVGSSLPSSPFAGVRLLLALDSVYQRRVFWSMSQWRRHAAYQQSQAQWAERDEVRMETAEEEAASSRRVADKLACRLSMAESQLELQRQEASRQAESMRSKCAGLECRANALSGSEAALCAQLHAARVRSEALEQGNARAESQLLEQRAREQSTFLHEYREAEELKLQAQALKVSHARVEAESELTARRCAEVEELYQHAEESCAKLQSRLEKKVRWRSEAERQIREMVQCGEGLERERVRLRQKLAESREHHKGSCEHLEALRASLEQEEQMGELLRARTWALEEDNVELNNRLSQERNTRLEDATRHASELALVQQEHSEVVNTLCTAASEDSRRNKAVAAAAEERAAESARADLLAAWSRERDAWSRSSSELNHQLAVAHLELETMRHDEQAQEVLRRETLAAKEAAQSEISGEAEMCKRMAAELEHRLAQASQLQKGLEEQFAASSETMASCSSSTPQFPADSSSPQEVPLSQSGIETPQLHELDAYADLVERLREEVGREREERQASARSLEMLRCSYRLLLQRVSTPCGGQSANAGPQL